MDVTELFDLTGKVAVVTGRAGGIGEVCAEALCDVGASVVVADINLDAANRTADALTATAFRRWRWITTAARPSRLPRWLAQPSRRVHRH
jgi:NAD(P)-dependent dehydrogenase (short-subunit alcohol dehydrogenase family)